MVFFPQGAWKKGGNLSITLKRMRTMPSGLARLMIKWSSLHNFEMTLESLNKFIFYFQLFMFKFYAFFSRRAHPRHGVGGAMWRKGEVKKLRNQQRSGNICELKSSFHCLDVAKLSKEWRFMMIPGGRPFVLSPLTECATDVTGVWHQMVEEWIKIKM